MYRKVGKWVDIQVKRMLQCNAWQFSLSSLQRLLHVWHMAAQ